jgi:predicted Zn-dependent protease
VRTKKEISLLGLLAVLTSGGCTINPVTGQREFALVSAADEVAIGSTQYAPSRQMQGGDYVSDPALSRYVSEIGQKLGAVSDRALPYEFVVLNSSVPNAWALPGGKIAVNRGLLVELDSEAELAAVLGHEIVHAAARHGAQSMQRGILLQGAVLIAATATRSEDYSGLAVGAAGLGAQLINSRNGREAELESDRFGMMYMSRAGYDPSAAVTLQQTFLRLSEGRGEQSWISGLFASHPPSSERVEQNRATYAELPNSGELGQERYRVAIANLERERPGFAAYDSGRRALADGNLSAAEAAANEALVLLDDEGHVYSLLGDIAREKGNHDLALSQYQRAVALNRNYFYYHLGKAEAHMALGQDSLAQSEYVASISLLPTGTAYYGLGRIAERRGAPSAALVQYRRAAEVSGAGGDAARDAVVRLDLPTNPGQYLTVAGSLDSRGYLRVTVGNPTRYPVTGVQVRIRYLDASNRTNDISRTVPGTIPPNSGQQFGTGVGPLGPTQSYDAAIASARIVSQ